MDAETKAKWKRAEELVGESADLDPGDAAIMFMVASIISQRKYYNDIVYKTLNGEEIIGIEDIQDVDVFRSIKAILGNRHDTLVTEFMKSKSFTHMFNEALLSGLTDILHRMVLAVTLKNKIGDKFYEV